MGLFSFNKRPKHNSFDYTPRFYDPDKEALDQRIERHNATNDPEAAKDRIRSGLKNKYRGDKKFRASETKKSNIRLIVIIGVLLGLSMLLMQSDGFLKILQSFTADG